ncbi:MULTISPECIES: DUF305 domain-containing protein [unclassified Gordonia (in: high G+C Gram-positive bacteria)]|uniref:DUF305 domain-containing protein n=1 Tax=unclassified Gordonia (in: high G+C Gram-positive bacteria) TaxID=2657482 RepID=UPI001F112468|nr:DUF305 domain-containing protein [Gordonia sp. ABSL49_1]MCH5644541.1 DUF305 domain-containing protein [Gordonia sp. ABSL49_1]
MHHLSHRSAVLAAALAATVAFGVAGCANSGSPAGPSSSTAVSQAAPHNDADVRFTTGMIPHHEQALDMADLVTGRTGNAELIALATAIKGAQQPEIDQMTARLRSWGVEPPTGDHAGHGGHQAMPGMMSAAEMSAMRTASGEQFDRLWLQAMIRHHEGAVAMADTELREGSDPASKTLAAQIKSAQQREIAQMRRMLGLA